MELLTFFDQILLPYYQTYSHSNIEMGVRHIGGATLFVTEKYAAALKSKMSVQDIVGMTPAKDGDVCNSEIVAFCRQLDQQMIATPAVQEFIVRDVRLDGALNGGTNIPLFRPDGTCFGFQFMYEPYFNNSHVFSELLNRQIARFGTKTITLNNIYSIPLTEQEAKLLNLLILGYTQSQIAEVLKCSRSNVAKLIWKYLCPKFDVAGCSARVLVDKAVSLGYASFISKDLILCK